MKEPDSRKEPCVWCGREFGEITVLGFRPERIDNRAVGLIHFYGSEDGKTLVITAANATQKEAP